MKICGIVIKIGLNVLQIRTHRCARLEPNSNYFSRDVPERDNNRNIFLWSNFKIYFSGTNENIEKHYRLVGLLWFIICRMILSSLLGGVDGKAEAGNSVKQTPLVLCLNARARL